MKKLILVSATSFEIEPTLQYLSPGRLQDDLFQLGDWQIQVCITGIGMTHTAFALGRLQGQHFDLAINAGLAGSFEDLKKGTVVSVTSDYFADLGAEDGDQFLTLDQLGFGQAEVYPNKLYAHSVLRALAQKRGITVNTVHGKQVSIHQLLQRYPAETESMEGAAFFMAANAFDWNCAQIRAISNRVEKRNRADWEIGLAVKELNIILLELLNAIAS